MENNFFNSFHSIFDSNSNSSFEESFEIEKEIFMINKSENKNNFENQCNLNKKRKKYINEEEKKKEKRRKNKEAAKKSRDKKRKQFQILFEENQKLKKQIEHFKKLISINLCENCAKIVIL